MTDPLMVYKDAMIAYYNAHKAARVTHYNDPVLAAAVEAAYDAMIAAEAKAWPARPEDEAR